MHAALEILIEARSVETGDLVVLAAMVCDDFTACFAEVGEGTRPSANVGRIERIRKGGGCHGKGRSVPMRIIVDDVFEPILMKLILAKERAKEGVGGIGVSTEE